MSGDRRPGPRPDRVEPPVTRRTGTDDWFVDSTDISAPPAGEAASGGDGAPAASLSVVRAAEPGEDWFTGSPADPTPPPPLPGMNPAQPVRRRTSRRRWWPSSPLARAGVAATATTTVLIAIIAAISGLRPAGHPVTAPPAATTTPAKTTPTVTATTAPAGMWCAGLGEGTTATATSPDPGMAVIAAFETAYYTTRDAGAARKLVTPDGRVGTVDELSAGIATVPPGTSPCVLVTRLDTGLYAADVFARHPSGGEFDHFRQTITTTADPQAPQRQLITSITERDTK
ncbi:hypothetical protein ACWDUL_20110 [Nocardia niigatensis]